MESVCMKLYAEPQNMFRRKPRYIRGRRNDTKPHYLVDTLKNKAGLSNLPVWEQILEFIGKLIILKFRIKVKFKIKLIRHSVPVWRNVSALFIFKRVLDKIGENLFNSRGVSKNHGKP